MARCEKRTVIPEPPPEEFVLTLSKTEAYTLTNAIMHGICWNESPGGMILNAIYMALKDAGVSVGFGQEFIDRKASKETGYTHVSHSFNPEGWRESA